MDRWKIIAIALVAIPTLAVIIKLVRMFIRHLTRFKVDKSPGEYACL